MKKILFDTDVLIEHLRGNSDVTAELARLRESQSILALTPVSEAEIQRGLRSNERESTIATLSLFECLDINRDIGRRAGEYLRKYSKSHGVEAPDALIAAAAVIHRFALCTFNWKHFPMNELVRYRIG